MKKRVIISGLLPLVFIGCSGLAVLGSVSGTQASAGMVSVVDTTGMDEAHKIWVQGHQMGGTDEGVAALLGTWQQESGLRADAIQTDIHGNAQPFNESLAKDPSVGGYGFGFPQLDTDRRANLMKFAESEGGDWKDAGLQLNYIFNHDGTDSTLLKQLIKGTDLEQVVNDLTVKYERAGVGAVSQRVQYAKEWLNKMKNESTSSTSGGEATSPGATVPTGWTIDKSINTANYVTDSYSYKQCTWWTYNRAKEFGISYGAYMGNGADWQNQAGYTVTTTPTLHSAVSFSAGQMVGDQWQADPTYGHVAFVEAIHSDGSILISQSGTGFSTEYTYQVLTASQASQLHYVIGK